MRVLITGGSGFIGTNLIEDLLRRGAVIRNLDIQAPLDSRHNSLWTSVDILDQSGTQRAVAEFQPTHVVHLAARTDLDEKRDLSGYAANIDGTRNVLEAIKSSGTVQRAVITSSMLVCEPGHKPRTDHDYTASTLYGRSKVLTELLTRDAGLQCTWTIVRPTTIWGPWHYGMRDGFFRVLQSGWYVHPAGSASLRSYGYVGNAVDQIRKILEAQAAQAHGRTLYLGDPPVNLRAWVGGFSRRLRGQDVREIPRWAMQLGAWVGDAAGWLRIKAPLTSYRLKNMTADNLVEIDPTLRLCEPLSYSLAEGIELTSQWLEGSRAEHTLAEAKAA